MLKGEQIVCVAFPKWEGDYLKSTVQLMSELARENEVLYVDYPYTWKDLIRGVGRPGSFPIRPLLSSRAALQPKKLANGATIHLLTLPPFLPANWLDNPQSYDRVLRYNARRSLRRIREAQSELGMKNPIVINAFNPALGTVLAGQLDESLLVYYCYDEISATIWAGKHGSRYERTFLQQVDLTVVSSPALFPQKQPWTTRCAIVKNGVGEQFFQKAGPRPADLPPPDRERPLIGYLGSVDERLDYDLLETVARAWPSARFVFLGRIVDRRGARQVGELPNVSLLGPRPTDNLVNYVHAFDVGLIPFLRNPLTAGIYPLKINEYLAAGCPVVATNFGDLSDFAAHIHIGTDADTFRNAIGLALSEIGAEQKTVCRRVARENTWSSRAGQLGQAIARARAQVNASTTDLATP